MKNLFLLILLLAVIGCKNNVERKLTIESANEAYDQLDLIGSKTVLTAILEKDSLDNETKCKALQRLAFQDWKYYKDYNTAKNRLMLADSISDLKQKTWCILARIERESGNYQNALNASERAYKYSDLNEDKKAAQLEFAQTVYNFSIDNFVKENKLDTNLIKKATDILNSILENETGSPLPSKLLLGLSLLQNNAVDLLKAWKSYYHIANIDEAYSYMLKTAKELNEFCDKWKGDKLVVEEQEKLIKALATSRFYEIADDYAICNSNEDKYSQETQDILTYAKYLKTVKNKTNEYYRLIAIGEEDEEEYINSLDKTREELWNNLSFLSGKKYTESLFLEETEKHFGARGFTGSTGNYNGYVLCLGHIVNQEKATIEQYGYKPEFTYTQIDLMTSNGYSSWFWEDKAIGGWGTEDEIIRVRASYLNDPFNAWKSITDTLERKSIEKSINNLNNLQKGEENNTLYTELSKKLRFDALNDLYNMLYTEGLRGNNLKLAFLSKYEQYRVEASILGHEGRHSIEQKYLAEKFKKWSNEDREFHAKLSQIIFATEPRLELPGMISDISESGHGLANKKIVEVAADWIVKNSTQIKGYASNKSPISQLYLLTNNQIKECYKSIDPLNINEK